MVMARIIKKHGISMRQGSAVAEQTMLAGKLLAVRESMFESDSESDSFLEVPEHEKTIVLNL